LLLLTIGCSICTAAAEEEEVVVEVEVEVSEEPQRVSYEELTFINFSDKPVEIYFVDTNGEDPNNNHKEYPTAIARPYELASTKTFSGHVFSYDWGGTRLTHTVEQTNDSDTVADADTNDGSSKIASPQIHILGDTNLSNDEVREKYNKLIEQKMIYPKHTTKVVVILLLMHTQVQHPLMIYCTKLF